MAVRYLQVTPEEATEMVRLYQGGRACVKWASPSSSDAIRATSGMCLSGRGRSILLGNFQGSVEQVLDRNGDQRHRSHLAPATAAHSGIASVPHGLIAPTRLQG